MIDTNLTHAGRTSAVACRICIDHRVWLATATVLAIVTAFNPAQGAESLHFALRALLETAPYLLLSISLAAYAGATGADALIARAFTGAPVVMIFVAAAFGGLSGLLPVSWTAT